MSLNNIQRICPAQLSVYYNTATCFSHIFGPLSGYRIIKKKQAWTGESILIAKDLTIKTAHFLLISLVKYFEYCFLIKQLII